jgi:hypothetical protein
MERIPTFGLGAVVKEDDILAITGISKRGTPTDIESRWTLGNLCARGRIGGIKETLNWPRSEMNREVLNMTSSSCFKGKKTKRMKVVRMNQGSRADDGNDHMSMTAYCL